MREGKFPTTELKAIDNSVNIEIKRIEPFEDEVTISMSIEDHENELNVAYQLGALLHSISVSRYEVQ
jgi:hypothetical protein